MSDKIRILMLAKSLDAQRLERSQILREIDRLKQRLGVLDYSIKVNGMHLERVKGETAREGA